MRKPVSKVDRGSRRKASPKPLATETGAKGLRAKAALMDSARAVFSERGFTHSRVQDITEAAGFSLGAFYRYFKDKDDILYAIVDKYFEQSYATTFFGVRYDPLNPMKSLYKSTLQTVNFTHSNRDIIKVLWETSQFDDGIEQKWDELRLRIISKISSMIARAQHDKISFVDIDPSYTAELLTGLTEQAVYRKIVRPTDVSAEETRILANQLTDLWGRVLFLPEVRLINEDSSDLSLLSAK